jgi:hypothetical protein
MLCDRLVDARAGVGEILGAGCSEPGALDLAAGQWIAVSAEPACTRASIAPRVSISTRDTARPRC